MSLSDDELITQFSLPQNQKVTLIAIKEKVTPSGREFSLLPLGSYNEVDVKDRLQCFQDFKVKIVALREGEWFPFLITREATDSEVLREMRLLKLSSKQTTS